MSSTIFNRLLSPVDRSASIRFQIKQYIQKSPGDPGTGYMVSDGHCFSTFSYDTGSFIPIEKLNEPFDFKKDEKFYIDFTVTPNLQIEKAEIKCSKTGPQATLGDINNPVEWTSYPSMFYTQPQDEFDEKGRVKILAEGKRQIKCYVLLGYRKDDTTKNGDNSPPPSGSYEDNADFVQILNTDIILLASMFSGIPVVFPAPYLNASDHVRAIKSEEIL